MLHELNFDSKMIPNLVFQRHQKDLHGEHFWEMQNI